MSDPTLSDIDFKNKMAWVCTTLNILISKTIKKKSESKGSRSKSVGRGHLGSNFGFCRNIDKETISRHDLIEKDIELLGVRKAKLGQFLNSQF